MDTWLTLETFSRISTLIVLAYVGWIVARKRTPPRHVVWWIVLILFVLAGWGIGPNAKIISIFGFTMYLSELLEGFAIGLLIGFIIPKRPVSTAQIS